jgi:hypothetical protein
VTASRLIFVLGTSHRVQGSPIFPESVDDPGYTTLVSELIFNERIDFVFEEAGGGGQTTAARLAGSPEIRYRDIDADPEPISQFGIRQLGTAGEPDPGDAELVEDHNKREERWCARIVEQDFKSGLVICGYEHTLSISFKLRSAGLDVKCGSYLPYDKLCSHDKGSSSQIF